MRQRRKARVVTLARTLLNEQKAGGIPSDVLGSYTGQCMDGSRPVQDADDL